MIDIRGVSYAYEGVVALSDVTLRVSRGESVALIGPNGCGKSTLLKLINGIVCADAGNYFFDGQELTRKNLKDPSFAKRFHGRVGFLFQNSDAQLFCPVVFDEIAFGPRQMGLDEKEVSARVLDCAGLLGLEHALKRAPYHLSEGEKRKVALAAVLAMNPEVLTLDEPMNGLDARTKHTIREVVLRLHASGKTVLCSTHDFKYVEGLFSRGVALSEDHAIARDGEYEAVIADSDFLSRSNII